MDQNVTPSNPRVSHPDLTHSTIVKRCQICDAPDLRSLLFLGYVPPLNRLYPIGERPREETVFPAEALFCSKCHLVQLGLILARDLLFPPDYPYLSGTTRVQREDFADLYRECQDFVSLGREDLALDIGSNNGTLLGNFKNAGHRVLGIEPTHTARIALERGIPTVTAFFAPDVARRVRADYGSARVVTATNLLAHVAEIHDLLEAILIVLEADGILIAEVQDLFGVVTALQYDSFYHEHMRYYSLESLSYLLRMHGLEIFHARRVPTHGGSLRIYAARQGRRKTLASVAQLLNEDDGVLGSFEKLREFSRRATMAKLELQSILFELKRGGQRIFAVGAASRASMLVHYVALDNGFIDCVLEIPGSPKLGTYMPGTLIPIVEESRLWEEQPDCALLLSWHVADDLIPKLTAKGFQGDYLVPLPSPKIATRRHTGPPHTMSSSMPGA